MFSINHSKQLPKKVFEKSNCLSHYCLLPIYYYFIKIGNNNTSFTEIRDFNQTIIIKLNNVLYFTSHILIF